MRVRSVLPPPTDSEDSGFAAPAPRAPRGAPSADGTLCRAGESERVGNVCISHCFLSATHFFFLKSSSAQSASGIPLPCLGCFFLTTLSGPYRSTRPHTMHTVDCTGEKVCELTRDPHLFGSA